MTNAVSLASAVAAGALLLYVLKNRRREHAIQARDRFIGARSDGADAAGARRIKGVIVIPGRLDRVPHA